MLQQEQEAPDDIMPAPGMGPAYRANIHQEGVENPWPSIVVSESVYYDANSKEEARVSYRKQIDTPAGETRNNIIKATIPGKEVESFSLYADNVPQGITLTDGMQWSGPRSRASVLVIEIASDVALGEYPLEIGWIINGKDYGTKTCTIKVIPEEVQPQDSSALEHARPYRVVSEGNLANEDPGRSVGLWFITSEEASGFEEYAQTAVQAVLDLYRLYGRDYTSVLIIPSDKLEYAGLSYAQANFAADGKGAAGMTGDAPAKESYWVVWAADRELNEQELAIAELWKAKQQDFPQTNPVSSLSYDEEALRQYIADTLDIPYDEVQIYLEMLEYELNQTFVDETVSLATNHLPNNPRTEIALESLREGGNLDNPEKAAVATLLSGAPDELRSQFAVKYETAEEVSRDSHWMVFSSWRPYTQSSEYQQLLEFCHVAGQAVWPLLFQRLDSENPHFAGGLILDVTIPEYLYYFEEAGRQSNTLTSEPDFFAYIKELLVLLKVGDHEK